MPESRSNPAFPRWLLVTGAAYAVMHHVGSLPGGLGEPGWGDLRYTRWADWIDLLTPYLVLIPAGLALVAARPGRGVWLTFGLGAVAYAQGHGIHLSANSIGNVAPGGAAHLWDEVVGHLVWYLGVALVTAALAVPMAGRPRPSGARGLLAGAVALGVGVTWATNAIGGGTVGPAIGFAAGLTAFGWRHRRRMPVLLILGYVPALLILVLHSIL